jgi:xanthine dehydrogenase accessory factor
MRDLLPYLQDRARPVALATVVDTRGNTPRQAGTALAVTAGGEVFGAVSGGCVDAEVYRLCQKALSGAPPCLVEFGHQPDDPFAIGLSCAGTMAVFVQRVDPPADPAYAATLAAVGAGQAVAYARIVRGPAALLGHGVAVGPAPAELVGALGDPLLERQISAAAQALLPAGGTRLERLPRAGAPAEVAVFVEAHQAPARLLVFGAVDVAPALAELGTLLGYRVTVCDPRALFADPARFPAGTEVVVDWPHRYLAATETAADTVICALTHDPRFDVPLLSVALSRPAAYVGALGSRASARRRIELLRAEGHTDAELARLRAPIGLDLGGRGPRETALAILSEVVALRHGGSGRPLAERAGPIHPREVLA